MYEYSTDQSVPIFIQEIFFCGPDNNNNNNNNQQQQQQQHNTPMSKHK
jgi:hypothetical protein